MKLITANKLNRLWKNGITPALGKKIDKTKVLTSVEQVTANTNTENITGAGVTKELINNLNGYSFGTTADGRPGYRKPGADTVIPFSNMEEVVDTGFISVAKSYTYTYTADKQGKYYISAVQSWRATATEIAGTITADKGTRKYYEDGGSYQIARAVFTVDLNAGESINISFARSKDTGTGANTIAVNVLRY